MNFVLSNFASILAFSLIFFLAPINMNNRNKFLILFLSIACDIIGQITFFLFSWLIAVFIVIVYILCISILVGGKVQWLENDKREHHKQRDIQNSLPLPMFSFDELKERSKHATDLDFSSVIQSNPSSRGNIFMEESVEEEVAATIDSTLMPVLTRRNETMDIVKQENLDDEQKQDDLEWKMKSEANQEKVNKVTDEDEFDADIQQIFENRFKIFEENEKLGDSKINMQEIIEEPEKIRNLDDLNIDSQEDLKLLYERLKGERERG